MLNLVFASWRLAFYAVQVFCDRRAQMIGGTGRDGTRLGTLSIGLRSVGSHRGFHWRERNTASPVKPSPPSAFFFLLRLWQVPTPVVVLKGSRSLDPPGSRRLEKLRVIKVIGWTHSPERTGEQIPRLSSRPLIFPTEPGAEAGSQQLSRFTATPGVPAANTIDIYLSLE